MRTDLMIRESHVSFLWHFQPTVKLTSDPGSPHFGHAFGRFRAHNEKRGLKGACHGQEDQNRTPQRPDAAAPLPPVRREISLRRPAQPDLQALQDWPGLAPGLMRLGCAAGCRGRMATPDFNCPGARPRYKTGSMPMGLRAWAAVAETVDAQR